MNAPHLSRRAWLQRTGLSVAGLALASRAPRALAQASSASPSSAASAAAASGPVRLNYNENPFGPSRIALAAIDAAKSKTPRYPEQESGDLLDLIARKERVTTEQIFLTAGSSDILTAVGMHVGLAGGEVLTGDPAYLDVVTAAKNFGGSAVMVPLNARLEFDLAAIEKARITPKTGVVYLCNPSNPTGTVLPPAQLRDFCKRVSSQVPVFIDEAYLDLADDYAGSTMVGLVQEGHNVIVTRTFSKIYALAGERIGYGLMQPALLAKLQRYNTGSALSMLGVSAATGSLRDPTHVPAMHAKMKAGRDALVAVVKSLGKEHAVPQGNFVFFKTGRPIDQFIAQMKQQGVLIGRPFPPLLDWARISIGLPSEMEVCHAAMKKVLG